jgi:hypothetical protein
MDMITFIIFVTLAFYLGWFCRGVSLMQKLAEDPERIIALLEQIKKINAEEQQETSGTREIKVEQEKGSFYLFAKDNDEFLGQGNSLEEALEAVRKRFPGQNFQGHIPASEAKSMGLSK